jgi:DnaJ-class molecular chaperone
MKAVLCPVCNGAGKLVDYQPGTYTSIYPQTKDCHGCGGLGWVTVPEDSVGFPILKVPEGNK